VLQRAIQGAAPHPGQRSYWPATTWTGAAGVALEVATPWCNSGKADIELSALHVAAYAALGRQSDAMAFYRDLVARAPDNPVATHTWLSH